jgi:hypothetical protein
MVGCRGVVWHCFESITWNLGAWFMCFTASSTMCILRATWHTVQLASHASTVEARLACKLHRLSKIDFGKLHPEVHPDIVALRGQREF